MFPDQCRGTAALFVLLAQYVKPLIDDMLREDVARHQEVFYTAFLARFQPLLNAKS